MAKRGAEEITKDVEEQEEEGAMAVVQEVVEEEEVAHHPYAFHVSGPRNVAKPNWRDLINSSWSVKVSSSLLLK